MKILFLSNLYPNPYQPHRAPWNRQQLAAVANRHAVRVISPLAWTDEIAWRRTQGRLLAGSRRADCDGVIVHHPRYYFPPRMGRQWYGACYRNSIARLFNQVADEFRPDVVLSAWAYPDGWAATRLAARRPLPCVVKVHGSDVLLLEQFPARRRKTVEALQRADRIVSVSQDLAAAMERMGVQSDAIRVVYDGVDTSLFSPGSRDAARRELGWPEETPAILFVGNLVPVKGIDRLIRASGELASRGREFHLHVIGEGALKESLRTQAAGCGIQDRVTFHGAKQHAELPQWFRAADVFCLPSHSEGVPNVLLEAAACNSPFVAFNVGGISEISDWGRATLVPADAEEELADALAGYLGAAEAAPLKESFRSFEDSATELEAVLSDAVEQHQNA